MKSGKKTKSNSAKISKNKNSKRKQCQNGKVTEPLGGIRLADYVRTVSDIPQAIIAKVAREVAAGMTHLHRANIVHGSLVRLLLFFE